MKWGQRQQKEDKSTRRQAAKLYDSPHLSRGTKSRLDEIQSTTGSPLSSHEKSLVAKAQKWHDSQEKKSTTDYTGHFESHEARKRINPRVMESRRSDEDGGGEIDLKEFYKAPEQGTGWKGGISFSPRPVKVDNGQAVAIKEF